MDKIRLIKPCEKYLESYLDACKEFKEMNINVVSYHDPDKYNEWKGSIFQRFEEYSKGIGLPEGYVPGTVYWLVDEKNYIGSGSIRHYLNENLKKFGGHIGYWIRPGYWNKGYGTLQLKLLLEKVREMGIEKALLTCDVENIASARVMEKNGGKRIDKKDVEVGGKTRTIYRYEIET
jgi:predicted acetyltransferase